jgi:hypothetical protein
LLRALIIALQPQFERLCLPEFEPSEREAEIHKVRISAKSATQNIEWHDQTVQYTSETTVPQPADASKQPRQHNFSLI